MSSRDSITRRIDYLEDVGFIELHDGQWVLGPEGRMYFEERSIETLLEIMCRRNVGLRSLLYTLSPDPMTIEEINRQQLETHPVFDWDAGITEMAKQRANWLRSLGLLKKEGQAYRLTDEGHEFTESAVERWADSSMPNVDDDTGAMTAGTYETTVSARAVDPEFRATVLNRYESTCPVSGVDHSSLLDVAHILSWSEYPYHRADLSNVVPLSKIHHAAFDRELFTIDDEYRLLVSPSFETESAVLQETIVDRAGDRFPEIAESVDAGYLSRHNEGLGWVAD